MGHSLLLAMMVNFGQGIACRFFAVHMLQNLQWDVVTYVVVNVSSNIVAMFFYPLLGKFSDRFGNVQMLQIGAVFLPILPILWMFLSTPETIILGPQLWSGFAWTAFNLAASNFIYDAVPPHARGFYVAYYNLLVGIGTFTGGITGTILIFVLPTNQFFNFYFVFFLSGIVRAIVIAIILPKIKEVRKFSTEKPVTQFLGFRTAWASIILGIEHLWKKHNGNHYGNHDNNHNHNHNNK